MIVPGVTTVAYAPAPAWVPSTSTSASAAGTTSPPHDVTGNRQISAGTPHDTVRLAMDPEPPPAPWAVSSDAPWAVSSVAPWAVSSDAPWAMQLVARVERVDPPVVTEIAAAAVLAVIGLLEDERAAPGGPWVEPLATWQREGRIRKLVRRARSSAWERAQGPAGHTARVGRAEVRAYVPCPMDAVPEAVAKLQIRSTELAEPSLLDHLPAGLDGLVVAITPTVSMTWGKRAAQSSHAGQIWWRDATAGEREAWSAEGRPVTVLHPTEALWPTLVERSTVAVRDGGFTEVPAGTNTAIAWFEEG